jgi:hypothetical protein
MLAYNVKVIFHFASQKNDIIGVIVGQSLVLGNEISLVTSNGGTIVN